MGEIADAMIGGELCIECGVYIEAEAFGIPIMCHDCHSEYQESCAIPHLGDAGTFCENFYLGAENDRRSRKNDHRRGLHTLSGHSNVRDAGVANYVSQMPFELSDRVFNTPSRLSGWWLHLRAGIRRRWRA